ncbi:MAG: hypothetical protein FWD57_03745 [Polyangiaceae bacterium]|nr:hypothetical protein [Polyangiaceae bacterium]
MTRQTIVSALMVLTFGAVAFACKAGGVGDPCIPNDEFRPGNPGATESGAQIEDRSFQCETRVCLVKHFRGRVSCPYGNALGRGTPKIENSNFKGSDDDAENCYIPGTNITVTGAVVPQCADRVDQVYCSCRCDGKDKAAKYCKCPDGFKCDIATQPLDPDIMDPDDRYCIKEYDSATDGYQCPSAASCDKSGNSDVCPFTTNSYDTSN